MLVNGILTFIGAHFRRLARSHAWHRLTLIASSARRTGGPFVLLAVILTEAGCRNDGVRPDVLVSVSISPSDSTVFAGDTVTYEALAEYESGIREPDSLVWRVSDSAVLSLTAEADGTATVVGLDRGEGYVICEVDEVVVDSSALIVVRPGDVRWRVEGAGATTYSGPALDAQGRIYTVYIDEHPGTLNAVSPAGDVIFSITGCWSDFSGSVLPDGTAYTTRGLCVQRNAPDGSVDWRNVDCWSGSYGGIAVDLNGAVICMDDTLLMRISPDGTTEWRTAFGATDPEWRTAPAIASNGDTYVAWHETNPPGNWLSRFTFDGTHVWTVPTGGDVNWATPALTGNRIVLSYRSGGVAVFESAGNLLWEGDWQNSGYVSSPVIDGEGNIYIQSGAALVSFAADGTLRWSADSLAVYSGFGVGAPTLLADQQLLVKCRDPQEPSEELCAVDTGSGALIWRSNIGGYVHGCAAVAPDGTVYVGTSGTELVALWNRVPPLTEGWPTEGGGMGRLRRQQ
jgi:hypothetical protein